MNEPIKKKFGFSFDLTPKKKLTPEQIKLKFMNGILEASNLPEESRLNLLGSLEGTVNDAQLMRIAVSNQAIATARSGGISKGKTKHEALIKFYEKNPSLHPIKSCKQVARQIIKLSGDDRRIAENQYGKERTIEEKIRDYRKSKK